MISTYHFRVSHAMGPPARRLLVLFALFSIVTPCHAQGVRDDGSLVARPLRTALPLTQASGADSTAPTSLMLSAKRSSTQVSDLWWTPMIQVRQRDVPAQLNVSLNSLLVGALTHSARIQLLSDEPLISETEITAADAAFDWTAFLDARWDDLSEPVGSTLTTGGPNRLSDHNANVEIGVRRRNVVGGEVEIGQRFGHQTNNSVFFVPNDQGTARLSLSYTQPLLRGAGRVYNTSLTVLAKLETSISRDEFERQLQDHLLDITQSYWNLYFERGRLLQRQRLLRRGATILQELESRHAIDALQSQIVRARAAVENRRAQLVVSRLAIRTAEARIRSLVNDPALGDTLSMELLPLEQLSEAPFVVDLQTAMSTALQRRQEMTVALKQIKSACVRMNMSKRETLPLLNLVLETYVAGLEGNSSVGQAFREQFGDGAPSYGVGLQYEYPIWNRAATSKLQKRRLEVRRLQHQFRATAESLKLEVEVAVHEVNAAYESLSAKRRAMEAAEVEVDYLRERWRLLPTDNGSASLLLEDLLDAQDRLTEAEHGLLQSTLEYALAQVTYKRATGELLGHSQVAIDRNCECNLPQQVVRQRANADLTHETGWKHRSRAGSGLEPSVFEVPNGGREVPPQPLGQIERGASARSTPALQRFEPNRSTANAASRPLAVYEGAEQGQTVPRSMQTYTAEDSYSSRLTLPLSTVE